MHEREGRGVQCDVDSARLCRHGVGVLGDGALVERVDLRHAGCVANVVRYLLEPGPRPSGYEQTEAISLAFVTALQVLPARQRAMLIATDPPRIPRPRRRGPLLRQRPPPPEV
jgi:hypothetical protein